MTFKAGMSGNPGGRPQEKVVTQAMRLAALRKDRKGRTALQRMANNVMTQASKKNPAAWAVSIVCDRLEGKVLQEVTATLGPSELFLEVLQAVAQRRVPERLTIDGTVGHSTVSELAEPRQTQPAE